MPKPSSKKKNATRVAAEVEHDATRAQGEVTAVVAEKLHASLLAWFAASRRDLPWRKTRDPYAIWLSEIMLQQTRVETVIPYYERFLASFPTVHALADAPIDRVLTSWSGLGYYRRARMLHDGARHVATTLGGALPNATERLRMIPGVGPYTAGAIASIAFGTRAALVDGNVARVLARLFAVEEDVRGGKGLARIWAIAEALVDDEDAGAWNQALMELGALVCVPREPRCLVCPVRGSCEARARGIERDLPMLKPKTKPRVQSRIGLVAIDDAGGVLLARRKKDGRFGGMWEPPSMDAAARSPEEERALIADLARVAGARIMRAVRAGEVTHVLSHRRLEVTVYSACIRSLGRAPENHAEYDAFQIVMPSDLAHHGVTTFARKVLAAAKIA